MTTLKRIKGIYIATVDGMKVFFATLTDALDFIEMSNNRNG